MSYHQYHVKYKYEVETSVIQINRKNNQSKVDLVFVIGNVSGILYMTLASEHEYSAFGGDGYPTNCTPAETQPPSDQFCQVTESTTARR